MNNGYYVGCISGTSVDGLDLALVEITDQNIITKHAETVDLPHNLRTDLLALGQSEHTTLEHLGRCNAQLGTFIGQQVARMLSHQGVVPDEVIAIGSHGQTVRHRPDGANAFTLQIGDAARIAECTGITTIADFRHRDMAAGGQGAPLVPPFHRALFQHLGTHPVVVNIGGIANVSLLAASTSGFDTGPGNCLMDGWCELHQQVPYDKNGAWAATGHVHTALLDRLLSDAYFRHAAPKSTGREYFHLAWLRSHLSQAIDPADVQATLCELTARSIIDSLKSVPTSDLIVVGGGRLNQTLMQRLSDLASCRVVASEVVGIDGDSVEAAAFAWLAARTMAGLPGNEPAVTGAGGYRVLGAIHTA